MRGLCATSFAYAWCYASVPIRMAFMFTKKMHINCYCGSHQFLPIKSLVYLDPPYYVKGAGLYRNFYKHEDHVRIAKLLGSDRFRRPWVVSYDNADEIKERTPTPRLMPMASTTQHKDGTPVQAMFFSERIEAPLQAFEKIAA